MENKKRLCVFGDSWTDENWSSYPRGVFVEYFPHLEKWGAHVTKMLEMECHNFGHAGSGNWRISQTVMEQLFIKNVNPDCVMILWSEPVRVPFGSSCLKPGNVKSTDKFLSIFKRTMFEEFKKFYELSANNVETEKKLHKILKKIYLDHINQIIYISKILEEKNIPYVMAQAFHPHTSLSATIPYSVFDEVWSDLIKEHTNKIPKNVLGWPFVKDFGGWNMGDEMSNDFIFSRNYHPNEKGHLFIANKMLEGYFKLYE